MRPGGSKFENRLPGPGSAENVVNPGRGTITFAPGSAASTSLGRYFDYTFAALIGPSGNTLNQRSDRKPRRSLLAGDSAKAKAAYHDFLAVWKDADPDVPILKQAKAEYAKLQ